MALAILWIIGLLLTFGVSGFIFWVFWWPIRLFLYSLIPVHAAFAWIGKLLIIFFVGWLGGIGLPMLFLALGIMFIAAMAANI